MINEYANNGDLKTWLQTDRSVLEWTNMYFQVYAGLYTLQKYFDLTHHDLHWGNVLVHKIEKTTEFLNYKIDDHYYKVPNTGFLFTLWDFGYAKIPGKLQAGKNKDYKTYYRDEQENRYADDYFRIANAINWNIKKNKNGETNGNTPDSMFTFFNIVKQLYKEGIPLKYIFKKLFSSFLISNEKDIKSDMCFRIDDNVNITLAKNLSWLNNNNNNYTKAFTSYGDDDSVSYSNTEEFMDLYRTHGEYSIEQILKKAK